MFRHSKRNWTTDSSVLALTIGVALTSSVAHAQAPAPATQGAAASPQAAAPAPVDEAAGNPGSASADEVVELVVTGSRLGASGFQAPTPVTVAASEDLKAAAPTNLADGLNQLPVFNDSSKTSQGGGGSASGGAVGQNLLNLRGLGPSRNLVLLDGRRLVATNQTGSVDINILPQNLVSRVDVVTGGASAAYGSDAVAGVVNFVLNTKFRGLSGEVQGGISTHGDLEQVQASLAYGASFADDRGRVVVSGLYARQEGIGVTKRTNRDWFDNPSSQITNPVAGAKPDILVIPNFRAATGSFGGLITAGALRGTQFLPGGATGPFQYGSIVGTTFMSGGEGPIPITGFSPDQRRGNAFVHAEFDFSDAFTVFAEGLYAESHTYNEGSITQHVGSAAQFIIFRDNPYLPANIRAQMVAQNLQSINVGRYFRDLPPAINVSDTTLSRMAGGLKGSLGGAWTYNTSYTFGRTVQSLVQRNRTNMRNLYAAVDAAVDSSGRIVCRSTLSGYDPGCVPMNIFGEGSVTPEAARWAVGDSGKRLVLTQHVALANVSGDLGEKFNLGAGPISLAVGLEYRKEVARQTADAISQSRLVYDGIRGFPTSTNNRIGGFQSYNPQPLSGSFDVKELYGEIGVPVLKDVPFAQTLDLNGAVRRTDYSQSGVVVTWKYGATWLPIEDIRLRYTRSRDIRGPNILELFNTQQQLIQNVIYQGRTTQNFLITSGNPNLGPERATTETFGVVFRPRFIPGLQFSIDRYKIKISDSIGNLTGQQTVDLCEQGQAIACNQITVTTSGTLIIRGQTLNLNEATNAGYDFELQYNRPALGGNLQARLLVNHQTDDFTRALGNSVPVVNLGTPNSPKWRATGSLRYTNGPLSLRLQERFLAKSVIDPRFTEGNQTSYNNIPAVFYTDLTAEYDLKAFDGEQQLFVSVTNLFDREPPLSTSNPTSFVVPANLAYDWIGRYVTAGVRFKF